MTLWTSVVGVSIAALLTSAQPAVAQSRPALPIAYVSMQRILNEADSAKAAAKELETLRASRAKELGDKKQTLDATRLQLANAGGFFSGSKRAQLTELVKQQETDLQQATQKAQTDFNDLQKKVQERLRSELNTIILAMATQRRVPYVLNQDAAVILAPSAGNWTDEVLQRLNTATAQAKP